MEFVVILIGWIFGVCCHEYAHAVTAYYGGDTSVEEKGYLDFNPLAYTHPVLSVVMPVILLAMGGVPLMGGAVYIDTSRLRSRHWESAVAAAGPLATLLFAIVLCLPFAFGVADPQSPYWQVVAVLAYLEAMCFFFNLLPIPGVDGYGILDPYLPRSMKEIGDQMRPYGIFVLLVIGRIPEVGKFLNSGAFRVTDTFHVDRRAIYGGWEFLRGQS